MNIIDRIRKVNAVKYGAGFGLGAKKVNLSFGDGVSEEVKSAIQKSMKLAFLKQDRIGVSLTFSSAADKREADYQLSDSQGVLFYYSREYMKDVFPYTDFYEMIAVSIYMVVSDDCDEFVRLGRGACVYGNLFSVSEQTAARKIFDVIRGQEDSEDTYNAAKAAAKRVFDDCCRKMERLASHAPLFSGRPIIKAGALKYRQERQATLSAIAKDLFGGQSFALQQEQYYDGMKLSAGYAAAVRDAVQQFTNEIYGMKLLGVEPCFDDFENMMLGIQEIHKTRIERALDETVKFTATAACITKVFAGLDDLYQRALLAKMIKEFTMEVFNQTRNCINELYEQAFNEINDMYSDLSSFCCLAVEDEPDAVYDNLSWTQVRNLDDNDLKGETVSWNVDRIIQLDVGLGVSEYLVRAQQYLCSKRIASSDEERENLEETFYSRVQTVPFLERRYIWAFWTRMVH